MSELFYGLAALACPLGMGLMMWFMMRGGHGQDTPKPATRPGHEELARLRAEVDHLRAAQDPSRPDRAVGSPRP